MKQLKFLNYVNIYLSSFDILYFIPPRVGSPILFYNFFFFKYVQLSLLQIPFSVI